MVRRRNPTVFRMAISRISSRNFFGSVDDAAVWTARVLPDGRYWPRPGRTRLILGPPLFIDPGADAAETTRRIEDAVRRLAPPGAKSAAGTF